MSAPITNSGAETQSALDILRAHLSPAFKGPAWEALLEAVATGDAANWDNLEKAFAQLFLSSASGTYLDAHGSKDGVPRTEGVGLGDENYRKLILALRTRKLSADAIYRVLEVFYGEEAVRAYVQIAAEPYTITTGLLWLEFEDGEYWIDFSNGTYTADELANVINVQLNAQGSKAYAKSWTNGETGLTYLRIYSGALGIRGYVKPTGGSTMPQMGFSGSRIALTSALDVVKTGNWLDITTIEPCVASAGTHHTFAIKDGTLWSWGQNDKGQLGQGTSDANPHPTPVQVGTDTWLQVAGGYAHSLAIKSDGTLWSWGWNNTGQLGQGAPDFNPHPTPVQVGVDTWSQVSCGSYHSIGIKSNGSLWAWGYNNVGQLGHAPVDIATHPTPVQVGTDTWSQVSCGSVYTFGIKTDGTLWGWGRNAEGQLGLGDVVTPITAPTQVGTDTWSQVSCGGDHTLGIKSDGTLWSWGANGLGQLGQGTNDNNPHPTPVQVGVDTWSQVSCGNAFTIGIKSDGTLWSWGYNGYGQLGQGITDFNPHTTPIQVGVDVWSQVSCGSYHTVEVKLVGSLWSCGYNAYGQLGTGNTTDSNVLLEIPIEIPIALLFDIRDGDVLTITSGAYVGKYVALGVDRDARFFRVEASPLHVDGTSPANSLLVYAPLKSTLQESSTSALVSVTRGGTEISIPVVTRVVDRTEKTAAYLDDAGPYIYDPITGYSLTARQSTTTSAIRIQQSLRAIPVTDSTSFHDTGWVLIGLGCSYQTGPIKYIGKNAGNLIIDSATVFTKTIPSGATVHEVLGRTPWQPELNAADDEFTLTNSGVGLKLAKDTIESITGGGLPIQVNIQYPSKYGYGGSLSRVSDIVRIYGSDEPNNDVQEVLDAT